LIALGCQESLFVFLVDQQINIVLPTYLLSVVVLVFRWFHHLTCATNMEKYKEQEETPQDNNSQEEEDES